MQHDDAEWHEFMEWAKGYDDPTFTGRSRVEHDAWMSTLGKPVLRLDSRAPVAELVDSVCVWSLD